MKRSFMPLLLLALAGCEAITGGGCTLIGCINGLGVKLDDPPAGAFRIEVRSPGGGAATYSVNCASAVQCGGGRAYFADYMPPQVEITVVSDAGSVKRQVEPRYVESRPNGDGCGPVCRQATVSAPAVQ